MFRVGDDVFPLVALGCGTIILTCSIFVSNNRELAIAGMSAATGLFGVAGTAYQTKVKEVKSTAPVKRTRNTKPKPKTDDLPPES